MKNNLPHSTRSMALAEQLRGAGWSLRKTAEIIGEETGRTPSTMTVLRWTDPTWAERDKRRTRTRSRSYRCASARLGRACLSPEFKFARLVGLRSTGMSLSAIAKTMNYDFGDGLTEHIVRHALQVGHYPRSLNGEARVA